METNIEKEPEEEPGVDGFIAQAGLDYNPPELGDAEYARWMLLQFRFPAAMQIAFGRFIEDKKLFCTYEGKRYRCTGASRLGDVWLTADFLQSTGYQLRVDVKECTQWGKHPSENYSIEKITVTRWTHPTFDSDLILEGTPEDTLKEVVGYITQAESNGLVAKEEKWTRAAWDDLPEFDG